MSLRMELLQLTRYVTRSKLRRAYLRVSHLWQGMARRASVSLWPKENHIGKRASVIRGQVSCTFDDEVEQQEMKSRHSLG